MVLANGQQSKYSKAEDRENSKATEQCVSPTPSYSGTPLEVLSWWGMERRAMSLEGNLKAFHKEFCLASYVPRGDLCLYKDSPSWENEWVVGLCDLSTAT